MTRAFGRALTVGLVLSVAACGSVRDSRFNPFNWFSRSEAGPATLAPEGGYGADDLREPVAEVTALEVTRTTGGAVVTARGLPPTQGYWDAELVAENFGDPVDGVLTYRFVVADPRATQRVSTPQSREVSAATFISDVRLAQVSRIVVQGAANSRSSSR